MNPTTNTKKNYLYNVVCELITTLIPLITTPYVTRMLGKNGMGAYQYVLTIATYFGLFANCGIKAYGNRCIAQAKDDFDKRSRVFSGILFQQMLLSFAVLAVYVLYMILLGAEYRALFAVFIINLISAMLDITWLFWGMEQFRSVALSTIASRVAVAIGIFSLVRGEEDLQTYAILCSLGVIAVQAYLWTRVHPLVRIVRVPAKEIRCHLLPCLTLLIPTLAPTLFRTMDKLMLESVSGADAVGLYGAAEQLQTCMLGFITGLGVVMLPRISHLLSQGKEDDANDYIAKSMQFSVFIGCAFAFGIAAVADVFVPLYYGSAFAEAASLTVVLSPTIIMLSWAEVIRTQYIIPRKRDRIFVISILCGTLINLICNAVCIPLLARMHTSLSMTSEASAALGALPGTLLAEFSVILVQYLYLRRELPFAAYLRQILIFPAAGILMLLGVKSSVPVMTLAFPSLTASPLPLLAIQVILGAAIYLLIIGIFYACFRREMLRALLRRSR